MRGRGLVLAAVLGAGAAALAQTSDLQGTVRSDVGPVAAAEVQIRNIENGLLRVTRSNDTGSYRLASLPPGNYRVAVSLVGFETFESALTLRIGSVVTLDVRLEAEAQTYHMNVTAAAQMVEPTESDLSTVIEEREVKGIPLDGRTFSDLAILVPGVTLGGTFDHSKYQKNAISIGAQIGRGIQITIDGGDNNDDAIGGLLQHYSQESIQEFEVVTQRFKAEYGRSGGGLISVVTKSGGNSFRGSVFGYSQDAALGSKDYFEKQLGLPKSDFRRLQWGATLGGPIIRDRAHFFAAYERQDETAYHVVDTGGAWLQYEGSYPQPFDQDLVTVKLNSTLTLRQLVTVRYGYEDNHRENDLVEWCSCANNGAIQDNELSSLLLNHTWLASEDVLNEAVLQWSSYENRIVSEVPGPTLSYPSIFLGGNDSTPQDLTQKKYQWKDDFSVHADSHDFKAGIDWIHSPELGGSVAFFSAGQFSYSVDDPDAQPSGFLGFDGDPRFNRENDQVGLYIQDDWRLGERLVLNLGLRYDVEFGTFDVPETLLGELVAGSPEGRRSAGIERASLQNDVDNVGPRVGFAWDVLGDGRSIVRGGWGIFYDQMFLNATLFDDFLANEPPLVSIALDLCTSPDLPCFGPGTIPDLRSYRDPANGYLWFTSPDLETPYSVQSSLGISQQLGEHMALDVDLVNTDGHHELRNRSINHPDPATGRRTFDDSLGLIRIEETTGESDYRAIQLGFRGRWRAGGFLLSATLADAEVHQPDFGYAYPQDNSRDNTPDHERGDIGRPSNLEPWRVVLSGIVKLPMGFEVGGIVQAAGPRPYDDLWGYDRNGDGQPNDRVAEFNRLDGDATFVVDIRAAKHVALGKGASLEISADAFNLFNTENFGGNYDGTRYYESTDGELVPNTSYQEPIATLTPPRRLQLGLRLSF